MVMKERRIRCRACGDRVRVLRGERGPVSAYCDSCREARTRAQARARMAALCARQRQSGPAPVAPGTV